MMTLNSEYTRFFIDFEEVPSLHRMKKVIPVPCVAQENIDAACEHAKAKIHFEIDRAYYRYRHKMSMNMVFLDLSDLRNSYKPINPGLYNQLQPGKHVSAYTDEFTHPFNK